MTSRFSYWLQRKLTHGVVRHALDMDFIRPGYRAIQYCFDYDYYVPGTEEYAWALRWDGDMRIVHLEDMRPFRAWAKLLDQFEAEGGRRWEIDSTTG